MGKFRRHSRQFGAVPYTSGTLNSSEHQQLYLRQSCHSFYHAQLTPTLKDLTSRSYREQWSDKARFEIIEIDTKIGAKLAVTPLTEIPTDQHQQIMSKISNVIQ